MTNTNHSYIWGSQHSDAFASMVLNEKLVGRGQLHHSTTDAFILMIPGFGCTDYIFKPFIQQFHQLANDKNQCHYLFWNNRGIDPHTAEEFYSISDMALEVLQFLLAFKTEYPSARIHLQGISMGGFIAQEVIRLLSDSHLSQSNTKYCEIKSSILSLVLLCTTSGGDTFITPKKMTEEGLRAFYALDPLEATKLSTSMVVHPKFQSQDDVGFIKLVEERLKERLPLQTVLNQNRAAIAFLERESSFKHFDLPTLILTGADDRFLDPENSIILSRQIKGAKVKLISESDHFFFYEKPGECAKLVYEFYSDVINRLF